MKERGQQKKVAGYKDQKTEGRKERYGTKETVKRKDINEINEKKERTTEIEIRQKIKKGRKCRRQEKAQVL
jgi:hypothetical protein